MFTVNVFKWNKVKQCIAENRDVHLLLHLVKVFNNQRVIFPLRKVWKNSGVPLCIISKEAYILILPQESSLKSPKAV